MKTFRLYSLIFVIIVFVLTILYVSLITKTPESTNVYQEIQYLKKIISNSDFKLNQVNSNVLQPITETYVRDLKWHNCENIIRVGGLAQFKHNVKSEMQRIDGAWFVCFDDTVAPIENDCLVLSFGVRDDDSFEEEIYALKKCEIHSIDPFNEPPRIAYFRRLSNSLRDSVQVKVNNKWTFHSMGIVGDKSKIEKQNQKGWMATFDNFLDYLKIRDRVIDVLKMDIEGPEYEIINNFDMDYICKYVKQFMLETHAPGPRPPEQDPIKYLRILSKLEQCFALFYRHTRFYIKEGPSPAGWASEWQIDGGFQLDIHRFKNEKEIAAFMFANGELYFLNTNFMK